jgi:ubiquinone/menaquinone biosynthesis C-methylase UbiE
LEKDRTESKMTPRLRREVEGEIVELSKERTGEISLDLCCGVPMMRNSVLDGLRVSLFTVNQW